MSAAPVPASFLRRRTHHLDRFVVHVALARKDQLEKALLGDRVAGAKHQGPQQREFARCEFEHLAPAVDGAAGGLAVQATNLQADGRVRILRVLAAAVKRTNAGFEFIQVERLGQESSAPALSPTTRSPTVPRAVRSRTGVRSPAARAWASTCRPSRLGKLRSSATTSGSSARHCSNASAPSPHRRTSIMRRPSVRCSVVCMDGRLRRAAASWALETQASRRLRGKLAKPQRQGNAKGRIIAKGKLKMC